MSNERNDKALTDVLFTLNGVVHKRSEEVEAARLAATAFKMVMEKPLLIDAGQKLWPALCKLDLVRNLAMLRLYDIPGASTSAVSENVIELAAKILRESTL